MSTLILHIAEDQAGLTTCQLAIVIIQFYQMEARNLSLSMNALLLGTANTIKYSYRGQPLKKLYPLPALSLFSKKEPLQKINQTQNQAKYQKARKFSLKKALEEYSSELKKKQASSKQFNSRILPNQRISKKTKKRTNSEPSNPLVLSLPRKTELLSGLQHIQSFQPFLPLKQRPQLNIPKIYRTVRFIKRPKIATLNQYQSSRYLRWDSFCTPIACSKRTIIKTQRKLHERSSSINSISLKEESRKQIDKPRSELKGWEQQPKRYLTVYNSVIEGEYDQF